VPTTVMNARMYAVTPAVEAAWQALLEQIAADARVRLRYVPYPAPQPLEVLWCRTDLGCAFMCGYPIAFGLAPVVPIAAPILRDGWVPGRPAYRTDLIVRRDSPYRTLEDTFGGRAGWTLEHSHSGFNAFRHHLLAYRTKARPTLYGEVVGNLVTARNVLDSVVAGRIDIGPLDAYWHRLIARHAPELTAGIRVIASTAPVPMPALVAGAMLPADAVARLKAAFVAAASRPWFAALAEPLLLEGFAAVTREDYAVTLEWDAEAKAAGYPFPA